MKLWDQDKSKELNVDLTYKDPYGDAHTEAYYPVADGEYSLVVINKSLSKSETIRTHLSLYPNPASEMIRINSSISPETYTIFDMSEKIQMEGSIDKANGELDISRLKAGIYIFRIQNATKISEQKLFKR